ncbi:small-conductance mechanosensitive channel [Desulfocapsa sulfexigens DSM 10523]|uniref:Small-conductance mechanosensitive channel n=1 Tax=Desulfocapsa sulfexigens (strain DSM 10523 / SB164P1) TaxID=1167006 RepID=M1PL22_DESSD|nr:mechanosensitive ion channel domain-containing protein [Desulfocapsa sulfexigens]AGF77181.1 small-conductance mechanosensitive channel [Desulfocapsa sulfexigens DSM 10523]
MRIHYLLILLWRRIFCSLVFLILAFDSSPTLAAEPDTLLFSDKKEERQASYTTLQQSITEKLKSTKNEQEKDNLLMQQQILFRLVELPDTPEQFSTTRIFSELAAKGSLTWDEFEQFLDHHIKISLDEKKNSLDLENSQRQLKMLHSRLTALDSNNPEIALLQLQYAFKLRKHGLQQKIDKQLKDALEEAKKIYPLVLKKTSVDGQRIATEEGLLAEQKVRFQKSVDDSALSVTENNIRIQEQDNILQGYLGKDLTADEKKIRIYEEAKLNELKVNRLLSESKRQENNLKQLQQAQKVAWYRLLNENPDFSELTDLSNDILKQLVLLKKEITDSQNALFSLEKELALLSNTTDPISPKTKKLLQSINSNIQTIFASLILIDKEAESLDHRSWLLGMAIDLKQTGIGAVVTRTREATSTAFERVLFILNYPILSYSGATLSLLILLQVIFIIVLGLLITRFYGRFIHRLGVKHSWTEQTIHLTHVAGKYPLFLLLAMVALSSLGINTSSFAMIAGALSVGIGFGLKTIVNNLVSGFILLFDKSIRPGDFISLGGAVQDGGLRGSVVQMNIRASVLRTNDNINVIIPNATLMESQVVNWTYTDEKVRFKIPFSVAYGTDSDHVKKVIKEAMLKTPIVLKHPDPTVQMTAHGDNAVAYNANVWVEGPNARRPARTTDTILSTIYKVLNENDLEIPFPQLDVHLRSSDGQSAEKDL